MGRVVGSLSVVTCKDGDAESAMLASWISQASFDPPGLTVAVKRDRATESLMVCFTDAVYWPQLCGSRNSVFRYMGYRTGCALLRAHM